MLVRSAHLRSLGAGDTIFLTGDPGDSMMAVLTGTVRKSAHRRRMARSLFSA